MPIFEFVCVDCSERFETSSEARRRFIVQLVAAGTLKNSSQFLALTPMLAHQNMSLRRHLVEVAETLGVPVLAR